MEENNKIQEETQQGESLFTVETTKEKVTTIINEYLDQLLTDAEYRYAVTLDERVKVQGELPFIVGKIPLQIEFDPVVLESGDLLFKQRSISLGQFQLPNKQAMALIAQWFTVPEWVAINVAEESVHLYVTQIAQKNGLQIRMDQFDLQKNIISFHLDISPKNE